MPNATPSTGVLAEMTLDEVRQLNPEVVVLPIGSTEAHGPHLPYGTDIYQVDALCRQAVEQANKNGARALLYPTLTISTNANMKAIPFACRIRIRTFMNTLLDIIEALEEDGIRKIVLVNGHGGNTDVIHTTIREHFERHKPGQGAFICATSSTRSIAPADAEAVIDHPSDHAGESETCRMLYLRPDLVKPDKFDDFPRHPPALKHLQTEQVFFVRPWHSYLPATAGGETRTSTAEKGRALIDSGAAYITDLLVELSNTPWHDLFPYAPK